MQWIVTPKVLKVLPARVGFTVCLYVRLWSLQSLQISCLLVSEANKSKGSIQTWAEWCRTVFESFLRNFDGKMFLGSRALKLTHTHRHTHLLFSWPDFFIQKISARSIVNESRENKTGKLLKRYFFFFTFTVESPRKVLVKWKDILIAC